MSIKNICIVLAAAFFTLTPWLAQASTVSLSPDTISVHQGDTFSVAVAVNATTPSYTVKINASFTPTVLRLATWTFNNAWTALRQSGYDSFSNARGTMVRTGGYANGFTGNMTFGTATFVAAQEGKGTIALNANSFVYDGASQNTYTGANQVTVQVLPAVSKVTAQAPPTPVDHTFDIAMELPKPSFAPGEAIPLLVHLTNLSSVAEKLQVPIHYTLFNTNGDVVFDQKDTSALDGVNTKFNYQPTLPALAQDTYTLVAQVEYKGMAEPAQSKSVFIVGESASTNNASNLFDVSGQAVAQRNSNIIWYVMVFFIILTLILIFIIIVLVKNRNR